MREAQAASSVEDGWARRLRAGEVDALEEVFRAYYPRLCGFVRHQVGSPETAEELVQDVFLRVWERRARLDPDSPLRALLYRACRNAALNHLAHAEVERRWRETSRASVESDAADAELEVREHELRDFVAAAVQALPERCRLVFVLSRQHALGYREIAQALDISVKTVETQMGRALRSLRRSLAAHLTTS